MTLETWLVREKMKAKISVLRFALENKMDKFFRKTSVNAGFSPFSN